MEKVRLKACARRRPGHAAARAGGFDDHRNPAGRRGSKAPDRSASRAVAKGVPRSRECRCPGPADDRAVGLGFQVVDVDAHDDGRCW